MKNFIILFVFIFIIVGCKSGSSNQGQIAGHENYENVSCKDYSREFKNGLLNVVRAQSDNFFKQGNSTKVVLNYVEGNCTNVTQEISTLNVNKEDNWAIYFEKKSKNVDPQTCSDNSVNSVKIESTIDAYNSKNKLLNAIKAQDISMSIDTDKPCRVNIYSSKDELVLRLFVDQQMVKEMKWDFTNMIHPAELSLRMSNIKYSRKLSIPTLTEEDLKTEVENCVNKNNENESCIATNRTLKDWLSIN